MTSSCHDWAPARTPEGNAATSVVLEIFRASGLLLAAGNGLAVTEGLTAARWQVLGAVALAGRPLAWADDAAFMKHQPGFISTQLHRGTAGSTTFINVAVWESAQALGAAFGSAEFQARAARYPATTLAAPHVFTKVAVPGICLA